MIIDGLGWLINTKKGRLTAAPYLPQRVILDMFAYRMFIEPVYRLVDTNLASSDKNPI
jgi:hypothetical protein